MKAIPNSFRIILFFQILVFLLAAALHTGAFGVPALIAAMIVEGLCGIASIISAITIVSGLRGAHKIAVIVQVFTLAAVLLGITALARAPGLRTPLNLGLHAIMLALILTGLGLLLAPGARESLKRNYN